MENQSTFKNWHKSTGRATKSNLSKVFPVFVSGSTEGIEMKFEDEKGKKLVVKLNKQDSELIVRQLKRITNI